MTIIKQQGLEQISDSASLQTLIDQIIAEHPKQVAQYRAGKTKVFSFFVGQLMKATKGRANPAEVAAMMRRGLDDNEPH